MSDDLKTREVVIELLGNRTPLYIPQFFAHHVNGRPNPQPTTAGELRKADPSSFKDHQQPIAIHWPIEYLIRSKGASCKQR
jgi:hypothetical protein